MRSRRASRRAFTHDSQVAELLTHAHGALCSEVKRAEIKQRVFEDLSQEQPTSGGREMRRRTTDRAVARGRLPRAALIRRAVLVPVLALVLLAAMTAGAYALSADKNPDSALYPVKLFFERARFALTGSDLARAQLVLDYSEKRMTELEIMVANHTAKGSGDWLAGYEDNLRVTLDYCSRLEGDSAGIMQARLGDIFRAQAEALQSLAVQAPFDLTPAIESVRSICYIIQVVPSAPPEPAPAVLTPGAGNSPATSGSPDSGTLAPPAEAYTSPVDSYPYESGEPPALPGVSPGPYSDFDPNNPLGLPTWPWPYPEWWKAPVQQP